MVITLVAIIILIAMYIKVHTIVFIRVSIIKAQTLRCTLTR